ncbi:MAG: HPr family phosphocarrier protein [Candidatus Dadabacteria bacterium]|nr:HPr family phosphocarrier protein [Candidatus Dadabacteria bacterium]
MKNRLGLHARAAAQLVNVANNFASDITLSKDGYEVNGKSILGVLSLAAIKGTTIQIDASGADAEQVLNEIEELVESGFGEKV